MPLASDLVQFSEFLEKRRVLLGGARRSDVREYIQELFSHSLDALSGRKLSAIRIFIAICCRRKNQERST